MKIKDFRKTTGQLLSSCSIKILSVNKSNFLADESSKICHRETAENFSAKKEVKYEVKLNFSGRVYLQETIFVIVKGEKKPGKIVLENNKYQTFDLFLEDGSVSVSNGRILD